MVFPLSGASISAVIRSSPFRARYFARTTDCARKSAPPSSVCPPRTFSGGFPFNQASATFNLVIKGNATLSPGPLNFNGSFYVKGNWTQGGSYAIKGTIVCEGTCNIGGTGTVNVSQPPSFDPRYLPTITNYYGNLP